MEDLLIKLILAGYVFTAGCYIFVVRVYIKLTNHFRHSLKKHLNNTCGKDCFYCAKD